MKHSSISNVLAITFEQPWGLHYNHNVSPFIPTNRHLKGTLNSRNFRKLINPSVVYSVKIEGTCCVLFSCNGYFSNIENTLRESTDCNVHDLW